MVSPTKDGRRSRWVLPTVATTTNLEIAEARLSGVTVVVVVGREEAGMDVPVKRCAGLDVHLDTLPGCLRLPGAGGRASGGRRFGTMNGELLELFDWLDPAGV